MGYKYKPNKSVAKRFRVTGTGKLKRRHTLSTHLRSARDAKKKRHLGRPAILGVRPEHLAMNGAGPWSNFRTELVEPHGADNLVWCSRDRISLQVRLPGDFMPKLGTVLSLSPNTERISLFDSDTGDRL